MKKPDMDEIRKVLQNTPLQDVWHTVKEIPPIKAGLSRFRRKRKDHILFEVLPQAYDREKGKPVDPRKVLFVEYRKDHLGDSFRLIYDELSRNYDFELKIHYLRDSFVSHDKYRENCARMLEDMATASVVFVDDAMDSIGCIEKRPETKVVQLWHACGAFKKFGMSTAEKLFGEDAEEKQRHPYYRNQDLITVSSPEIIWAYAEAMDLKDHPELIRPLGISRTDVFFSEDFRRDARERFYQFFPAARGKKVILYAPTFRGRVAQAAAPKMPDLSLFLRKLKEDWVMVVKQHPLVRELPKLPPSMEGSFVVDATKAVSIEDLICVSDLCISDYSSLVFEYSLFERPMIFYAYDLEDYFDWRGFYYNYNELAPGPVCRTDEEMLDYILHLEERFDRERVRAFRDKFMSACDGHATERILLETFGEEGLERHRKKDTMRPDDDRKETEEGETES